jgi:hypothetical protein
MATPVGTDARAKTIIVTENTSAVLARVQPNASVSETKKTVNESLMPNVTNKVTLQTATITQP